MDVNDTAGLIIHIKPFFCPFSDIIEVSGKVVEIMSFRANDCQQLSFLDSFSGLTAREQKALENSWAKVFAEEIFPEIDEQRFSVLDRIENIKKRDVLCILRQRSAAYTGLHMDKSRGLELAKRVSDDNRVNANAVCEKGRCGFILPVKDGNTQ